MTKINGNAPPEGVTLTVELVERERKYLLDLAQHLAPVIALAARAAQGFEQRGDFVPGASWRLTHALLVNEAGLIHRRIEQLTSGLVVSGAIAGLREP